MAGWRLPAGVENDAFLTRWSCCLAWQPLLEACRRRCDRWILSGQRGGEAESPRQDMFWKRKG